MRGLMAALWRVEFAWRLSRQAEFRITPKMLRTEAGHLPQGKMPGSDRAKHFKLTLARSLHAAVTLLEREAGLLPQHALQTAGRAFGATGTWCAQTAIWAWLKLERDPFAGVVKRGPAGIAQRLWGNGMSVANRPTPDGVSLSVMNCPFQEYFWNVGRSDLTPILCAWDTAWQDTLNAGAKPIRVEILSTLAQGGKTCEFAFRKPTAKRAG